MRGVAGDGIGEGHGCSCMVLMVRRRFFSAVSNHESPYLSSFETRPSGRSQDEVLKLIHHLDRHCDTLADADAHRRQRALAAALLHAVDRGHGEPRAAHPKGMTERDGAAMRVDEIGIVLDAELAQAR